MSELPSFADFDPSRPEKHPDDYDAEQQPQLPDRRILEEAAAALAEALIDPGELDEVPQEWDEANPTSDPDS